MLNKFEDKNVPGSMKVYAYFSTSFGINVDLGSGLLGEVGLP